VLTETRDRPHHASETYDQQPGQAVEGGTQAPQPIGLTTDYGLDGQEAGAEHRSEHVKVDAETAHAVANGVRMASSTGNWGSI